MQIKKMIEKTLAMVLIAALLCGGIPVTSLASSEDPEPMMGSIVMEESGTDIIPNRGVSKTTSANAVSVANEAELRAAITAHSINGRISSDMEIVFTADITLTSGLDLIGTAGENTHTIQIDGAGHAIYFASGTYGIFMNKVNLWLQNTPVTGYSGKYAPFQVTEDSTLTLDAGVTVTANHGVLSGAILAAGVNSKVVVKNGVKLSDNTSEKNGGAITSMPFWMARYTSSTDYEAHIGSPIIQITDTSLINNSAKAGGAIYISAGELTLENVVISTNKAHDGGGGIMIDSANEVEEYDLNASDGNQVRNLYKKPLLQIKSGVQVLENTAAFGGGIYIAGEHEITSLDNTKMSVEKNHATEDGGGILVTARGENKIYNTVLNGNTADGDGENLFVNGFKSDTGNYNTYNGFLISGLEKYYNADDYASLEPGEGVSVGEGVYLHRAIYEYGAAADISGTSFRSYMAAKDSTGKYHISFCLEKTKVSPKEVPSLSNNIKECLTQPQLKAIKAIVMSWCTDSTHPERLSIAKNGTTDSSKISSMIPEILALQHSIWVITESSETTTQALLNEVLNASGNEPYYKDFSVSTLEAQISGWSADPAWITAITKDLSVSDSVSDIELSAVDFTEDKKISKTFPIVSDPITACVGETDIIIENMAELTGKGLQVSLHMKDADHPHDYINVVGEPPASMSGGKWLKSIHNMTIRLKATDRVPSENGIFENMKEFDNGASQNTLVLGDHDNAVTYFSVPISVTVPAPARASYAPLATKLLDEELCTTPNAFSFVLSETDAYWVETGTEYTANNDENGQITFPDVDISDAASGNAKIDYFRYFVMYEKEDSARIDEYYFDKHVYLITVHVTGDEMEESVETSVKKGDLAMVQTITDTYGIERKNYTKCISGAVKSENIEFKNRKKEYFDFTVTKEWKSSDATSVVAPTEKISSGLFTVDEQGALKTVKDADGNNLTADITAANGWTCTYGHLLRKDVDGNLINYVSRELDSHGLPIEDKTIFALADLTGNTSEATSIYKAHYEDKETPSAGNITDVRIINELQTQPTFSKKVLDVKEHEESTWEDANNAAIGETVKFRLESFVPDTSDFMADNSFLMRFVDTLPAGFDFQSLDSVKVSGLEIDKSEIIVQPQVQADSTKIVFSVDGLYKDLKNAIFKSGDIIAIEYSARLNERAIIGTDGNTNIGWLEYSDKKVQNRISSTPKRATKTYTGMFTIEKKDRESLDLLENVGFKLSGAGLINAYVGIPAYDENGIFTGYTPKKVNVTVDDKDGIGRTEEIFTDKNGQIIFYGMGSGKYTLTETTYLYDYKKINPVDIQFSCKENNDFGDDHVSIIANREKCTWILNDQTELLETVYNSTQNYVGSVSVTKLDAEDGHAIPGVTFTLSTADGSETLRSKDEKDNEIRVKSLSLKTGEDGKLKFVEIIPGKYILSEIRAANGKSLLKDPIDIVIPYEATKEEVEAQKDIDLSNAYYDEEKGVYYIYDLSYIITNTAKFDLPATGGAGSMPWVIFSVLSLAGLGLVFWIIRIKKKKGSFDKS